MNMLNTVKIFLTISAIFFVTNVHAQVLSVGDKTLKVEQFPEYIVINCDNNSSFFESSIRIVVQAKNSEFGKVLGELEDFLEGDKYMKIRNQTDLLNALSKLGFDFVDAFPQNSREDSVLSRTGFVFRKKEQYRK